MKKKNNNISFHPPSYTSISLKKKPRKTISTSPPKTFSPNLRKLSYSQAKSKIPNLPPYGDADGDHVLNKFDCRPFDYYKHKVPESLKDYPVHSVKKGKEKMSDVFFRLETRLPQVYKEGGSTEKKYSDITAKYLQQRRKRQQLLPKDTPYTLSTTPELKGKKTIAPKSHFDIVGIYPNIELRFTTQEALMVYKYIIEYLQKEHPSKRFVADPTNAKMFGKLKVYDYDPEKEYEQLKKKYIGQKFKQAMQEHDGRIPNELKKEISTLSPEEQAHIQQQISYDPYSVKPEIKDIKTLLKKAPQHIKSLQTLLNQKPIVTIMISDDPADVILQASQLKKSAEKTATFSDIKSDTGYAGNVLTAPSCQRIGGEFQLGSFSGADWQNAVAYIYTGNKKPDTDKWDGRLSIRWGLTDDDQVEVALEDCVYPWSKAGEEHGSEEANLIYSQAIKHALHKILAKKGYTQKDVNIKIPRDKGYSDVAQTKHVESSYIGKDKISKSELKKVKFPTEYYKEPDLSSLSIDKVDPAKYTKIKKGSIPKPLSQFLLSLPETHKKTERHLRGKGSISFTPAKEIMKKGSLDQGTLFANLQRYAPSIAKRETLPEEGTVFNYFATGKVPDPTARKSFLKKQKLGKEQLGPFFEKSDESDKLTEIGTLMQREYAQKQPYQLFALGEAPESAYHIAKSETISAPVLAKIAFAPKGKMTDAKKRLLHRADLAPRFIRALIKDPELHIHILDKQDTKLTNTDFENMFKNATDEIKRFLIQQYSEHLKTSTITSYITSLPHHEQKDELILEDLLFKSEYISFDITLACAKTGLSDNASNSDWMNFVNYTLARAKYYYQREGHTPAYKIIEQLIRTLPRHVIQGSPLSEILTVSAETTSADQFDDIITKLMKKVDKIRLQQKLQDNYYPIKERAKQSTIDKIEKFLKTEYTPKKKLDASKFEIGQPIRIKYNYDFTPDEKAGFVGPGVSSELKANLGHSAKITDIKPFGEITLSSPLTEHEFPVKPQWIKPLPKGEGRNFKKGDKVYLKTDNLTQKQKEDAEDLLQRMNSRTGTDATVMFNQLKNIRTPATVASSTSRNDAPYDNVLLKHHGFSNNYLVPSNILVLAPQQNQQSQQQSTQEIKTGDTVEILDYDDDDYPNKDEIIGRTGKLHRHRGIVTEGPKKGWYYMTWIYFRGGQERKLFMSIKLRKVQSFSVGQQVQIREPTEPRRSMTYAPFGTYWNPNMDRTIGQTGEVTEIHQGNKVVRFPDTGEWTYRPADLEPVNITRNTREQQSYSRDDPSIQGASDYNASDFSVGETVVVRNLPNTRSKAGRITTIESIENGLIYTTIDDIVNAFIPEELSKYDNGIQQPSRFDQSNVQEDDAVQIKSFTQEEQDRLDEEYSLPPRVSHEIAGSRMIVKGTRETGFIAEKISNEEETSWWLPYWSISSIVTRTEHGEAITNTTTENQTTADQLRNTDVSTSTFNNLIQQYIEDHSTEDTLVIIYRIAIDQQRKVHPGVYDLVRELVEGGDEQALSHFTSERYWNDMVQTYGEEEAEQIMRECASWYYQQHNREDLQDIIDDTDFPYELRDDLRSQYFDFLNGDE